MFFNMYVTIELKLIVFISGNVLTDTPYNMWKAGEIQKVPVVIGKNLLI